MENTTTMNPITPSLLRQYGASLSPFRKGQFIFYEDRSANYYFQLEEGAVKMFNARESSDFIQGFFVGGESFGEPALLGSFPYPADARALSDSTIWVLKKDDFARLLKENPDIHLKLTEVLCRRLHYKAKLLANLTTQSPEQLILGIIDYFKNKSGSQGTLYEVPFTRQLLADLTGLRVETVIKKVKQLVEQGELQQDQRRIYRAK